MRILLVDDHRLLLEGLQNLLEAHGLEVVAIARDGLEATARARELRPEVILMDVRMPGCDGLAATRLIKAEMPDTKIVMLTTSSEDEDLFEAVKSGAEGYLLKSIDADSLVEALKDAQRGIPPFSPGLAGKLLTEFARNASRPATGAERPDDGEASRIGTCLPLEASSRVPPGPDAAEVLSARQREVLTLLAQGLSYKEVGVRSCLSARTVKYHMAEIVRKLHLQNRAQVLAYAGRMATRDQAEAADRVELQLPGPARPPRS